MTCVTVEYFFKNFRDTEREKKTTQISKVRDFLLFFVLFDFIFKQLQNRNRFPKMNHAQASSVNLISCRFSSSSPGHSPSSSLFISLSFLPKPLPPFFISFFFSFYLPGKTLLKLSISILRHPVLTLSDHCCFMLSSSSFSQRIGLENPCFSSKNATFFFFAFLSFISTRKREEKKKTEERSDFLKS